VRYTRDLAVALAARGHDVTVVTGLPHYPSGTPDPAFGAWKPAIRDEDGVRVIRTPLVMGSNHQLLRRVIGFFSFVASALPWSLFRRRPDAVIASLPPLPVGPLGLVVRGLRRTRLVMLLRDVEPQGTIELRGYSRRAWADPLIRCFTWMYARADRIVVVHASQERALVARGFPADRVETIPHGIDVERFARDAARPGAIRLPRREGRALALFVGSLGEAQAIPSLIEAFADERVRSLRVDLVLVGDGEHANLCRRLVAERGLDHVTLLGAIPLDAVPAVLAQADWVVASYKRTELPMAGMIGSKFYEYFASGKPLVVWGDGVATDLVRSVGNGVTCSSGDIAGLRDALATLLADPDAARRMGERGREHARREFRIAARHDRWEALLRDLVAGDTEARRLGFGWKPVAAEATGARLAEVRPASAPPSGRTSSQA